MLKPQYKPVCVRVCVCVCVCVCACMRGCASQCAPIVANVSKCATADIKHLAKNTSSLDSHSCIECLLFKCRNA